MKKKLLIFAIPVVIVFSDFVAVKQYTQQQIHTITDNIVIDFSYGTKVFSFGDLLYNHLHAIADNDSTEVRAGYWTPKSYKNGMRRMIAENPQILHTGLSLFGKDAIAELSHKLEQFRDSMLRTPYRNNTRNGICLTPVEFEKYNSDWWKQFGSIKDSVYAEEWRSWHTCVQNLSRDSAVAAAYWQNFTAGQFWKDQRKQIEQYDKLMVALLALPDNQLNAYIAEIGKEQDSYNGPPATKTASWLLQKKLIDKMPVTTYNSGWMKGEQIWYLGKYPVDLLLFTYRMHRDFPAWTPRKILLEAKKFSDELKPLIP